MRLKTSEFIERIKELSYPDFVQQLILFGSEVYGRPRVGSDIDVAVVSAENLRTKQRVLIDELIDNVHPPFEYQLVFVTDDCNGKYKRNDVRHDIFERGVVIYEKSNICGDC